MMWTNMLKVAAATALFGVVHSSLASRAAKRAAAELFGERNRNGLYRVFYLTQSVVTCGVLVAYIRRLPNRELYRFEGLSARLMNAAQVSALVYATSAAGQVGFSRILGLSSLAQWLGDGQVDPKPEAQGPAPNGEGEMRTNGPYAGSRHPLNFAPLPVVWLSPRMTTSLLAFNVATTIYLVIGSLHEEARLREAYGKEYDDYLNSGVPFYVPNLTRFATESTGRDLSRAPSERFQ